MSTFYFQMIIQFLKRYEVVGDAFYYIIQYIGPEKEASQFKYKFVLERGAEEITVCNVASSYNTDVKELYNTVNVSSCSATLSKDS